MIPALRAHALPIACISTIAGFLILVSAILPPQAEAWDPEEDVDAAAVLRDYLSKRDAAAALAHAMPTPTPWEFGVMEISANGNFAVPERPIAVYVAGQAPINALPERCRDDFARLPRNAVLLCFADDRLARRMRGEN